MKKIYFLFLLFFAILFNAQNYSLNLKKLVQVNTYNGGQLVQSVLDNDGNTFFTGFANGNDYRLDGYIINPVGLEDFYLIKTDPAGNHLWEKTLNAGAKGTIRPKFIKVDNSGNSYVLANFNGTVNIGSNIFNSTTSNGLLIKLDSNGSYLWATQIADSNLKDYDICFGNNELFALSSSSFLYRINLADGSIISSFNSTNLTSIDYKDSSLYVGGYTLTSAYNIGTINIEPNIGFVIKGDNNFNFDSCIKFTSTNNISAHGIVKDVKFLADGSLEIVGISNNVVNLKVFNGISATFGSAFPYGGLFLWAAKIKSDFSAIDWFRGSKIGFGISFTNIRRDLYDIEIFPFGDSQSKIAFTTQDDRPWFENVEFFNGYKSNYANVRLSTILDINKNGLQSGNTSDYTSVNNDYLGFGVVNNLETFLSYNQTTSYAAKKFAFINFVRYEYWSKGITNYHGGTVKSNYLKSDASGNSYINNVASGEVNLLGKTYKTYTNSFVNTYSKVSKSGELIWNAVMEHTTSQTSGYNTFNSDVNTNGEFVTAVETPLGYGAAFISNSGVRTIFRGGNLTNVPAYNEIVKISNNGELLWHKPIQNNGIDAPTVMVFYDRDSNIIVWCSKASSIDFQGQTFNGKGFIAKLNGETGNPIFIKGYSGLDFSSGKIVFDEHNNIYAFYEPFDNSTYHNTFQIGNISIEGNADALNSLMVKLDPNGNPLFGKNFYENLPPETYKYSWPIDIEYDGANFVQYNVMMSNLNEYLGIDGATIISPYPNTYFSNSLSKISKDGTVLGVTPIFSTNSSWDGNQIDLDKNGNIYIYGRWKGNLNINNKEFTFSNTSYSSSILKFSPNGVINYVKTLYGQPHYDYNQKISIVKENVFNVSGNTTADNILGEPINFVGADNYYLATLEESYLQTIEAINKNFSIYPNPSSDLINIVTKEKIKNIEIYDSTGRKVTAELNLNNQIDIRKLIKGVYYIRITTDKNNLTSKFIKK
ncbi:T9SS type A sorting domain-containing protein [Epilithonimonas sp. JDS]|uniref:T9SS type A sorting domain-containing protein n=1 Tax=Epilithonimonas sp. JDS TaxID=2902797 RepID=UPI001E299530|nr:T9SS type A sorting domain-containing protein [Epilithonimonas sp. JDS]MCD9853929.1 T9SS type A sorting domain-containing protein [Epilithonimonas sp. JDS]